MLAWLTSNRLTSLRFNTCGSPLPAPAALQFLRHSERAILLGWSLVWCILHSWETLTPFSKPSAKVTFLAGQAFSSSSKEPVTLPSMPQLCWVFSQHSACGAVIHLQILFFGLWAPQRLHPIPHPEASIHVSRPCPTSSFNILSPWAPVSTSVTLVCPASSQIL